MKAKAITLIVAVALPLVLAACQPDTTKPPDPKGPPIIPDTTKVTDPVTRTALSAFDPATGTMRYAQSTPVLANLKPDDVLVSEPSSAAPNGYLRKVKAISKDGDAVVLETTQASLTDAISEGSLDAQADLKPSDLQSARGLLKGVRAGIAPQVGIGDGFNYEIGFDETILDQTLGDVKSKVQVSGKIRFNAGYGIDFDIRGPRFFPPRLPSLRSFEASVGISESVQLRVTGSANTPINKEKKVAEYRFSPRCFVILVVPVCVVPTFYVFLGVNGNVSLSFNYAAAQIAQAKVGARWTADDGWQKIDPTPVLSHTFDQNLDVNGAFKARAYAKAEAALEVYGVAGPTIGAKLGVELDAAIPRNPFWILRGTLEAYYALIVDVPIFGRIAESQDTLYDLAFEIARSPNKPPKLAVSSQAHTVDLKLPANLKPGCETFGSAFYTALDREDGCNVNVTVVSDRDGSIPLDYRFPTPGLRTLTVTARDSLGASSTTAFTIDVVNTPPSITNITAPTEIGQAEGWSPVTPVIATDPNEPGGRLGCERVRWSVQGNDLLDSSSGCDGFVVFSEQGPRTVTITATDPEGAVVTKVLTVNVGPRPAQIKPSVRSFTLEDSAHVAVPDRILLDHKQCPLLAKATIFNPDNLPVELSWTLDDGTHLRPEHLTVLDGGTTVLVNCGGLEGRYFLQLFLVTTTASPARGTRTFDLPFFGPR